MNLVLRVLRNEVLDMDEVKIVREEVGYGVIVNGKVVGMFDEFAVERRIDIGVMLICLRLIDGI